MFSNMKGGKSPVSLRSGNVSICHPWGPGTCQRAALQRKIPPLTLREITSFVLCQSTQILQRHCAPAPRALPLLSPEGAGCCLHVRKGQLNNADGVYLPDFIILSCNYLRCKSNLLSSRVLATEIVHHNHSYKSAL